MKHFKPKFHFGLIDHELFMVDMAKIYHRNLKRIFSNLKVEHLLCLDTIFGDRHHTELTFYGYKDNFCIRTNPPKHKLRALKRWLAHNYTLSRDSGLTLLSRGNGRYWNGLTPSVSRMLDYVSKPGIYDQLPTREEWVTYLSGDTGKDRWLYGRSIAKFSRYDYCNYSWTILHKELVDHLAEIMKGQRVLDAGCGSGMLVEQLRQRGVDAHGVDYHKGYRFGDYVNGIERVDMNTTPIHYFKYILMVWPPMEMEFEGLLSKITNDQFFIYCGEDMGGCTGTDEFHQYLEEHFEVVEDGKLKELNLPWVSIRDDWTIYRRRPQILENVNV